MNSQRNNIPEDSFQSNAFVEYKGVFHVHSFLGGHSRGSFDEIIKAAAANDLDFVVMTEHQATHFDTAEMTLKGLHAGILFINGNEVSTANGDRLLLIPGDRSGQTSSEMPVLDVLAQTRSRGALSFIAYPEDYKSWEDSSYDGIEIYNVYTNARQINPLIMFFDGLWAYWSYPDLLFATFYTKPSEALRRWDEAIVNRGAKLVAIAGNDAHANIGLTLIDSSGKSLAGIQLDPYERSFRLVRVHALLPKDESLTSDSLLRALAAGHAFIGFDLFCDSAGFSFIGANKSGTRVQGDEMALAEDGVRLQVRVPVSARVVLLKDGLVVQEESGVKAKEFLVSERGSYRVEVYLSQLPGRVSEQPWIISNPIYVR